MILIIVYGGCDGLKRQPIKFSIKFGLCLEGGELSIKQVDRLNQHGAICLSRFSCSEVLRQFASCSCATHGPTCKVGCRGCKCCILSPSLGASPKPNGFTNVEGIRHFLSTLPQREHQWKPQAARTHAIALW